jgi:GxxExxY protein
MPYEGEDPPVWQADEELNALTNQVIGAGIEVHRRLGPGLDEGSYSAALAIEFRLRSIPFVRQVVIDIPYKGEIVGKRRLDFIVGGRLIVELKAVVELTELHKAQVRTYLKITGLELGLLMNFETAVLKDGIRRVICARSI